MHKLGSSSLPHILPSVTPAWSPFLNSPDSPPTVGLLLSSVQHAPIPPVGSGIRSNHSRHGNICRTAPGSTSGNIHSSAGAAGCFYPKHRIGKDMKPERQPPSFSEKLELVGRETASPTVETTASVPPSHIKGKVPCGAPSMTDFRGKQIRHKNC